LSPPYGTIVADPPWQYRKAARTAPKPPGNRDWVDDLYSTMTMPEIAAMPVVDLAATNAHLFMWTTNPRLYGDRGDLSINPAHILEAWGFRYVSLLTWVKGGSPGMGSYFRGDTEHVLFGVRGKAPIPPELRESNVIMAPRGGHSVKPDAFGDLVEKVSPGPYVELFARQPRLGWDSWGHGYETAVPA